MKKFLFYPVLQKFLFYLTVPFRPAYWAFAGVYNPFWDAHLLYMMEHHKFRCALGDHPNTTVQLGDHDLFLEVYPVSAFRGVGDQEMYRPSRYTIYLLSKKLKEELHNQIYLP